MNIAEILGISSVSDVNVTNQTENVENTNEDFASYLNASTTTMDDIFNKASETYNVPVALLKAMAKQESNFDPNATSSSGAQDVYKRQLDVLCHHFPVDGLVNLFINPNHRGQIFPASWCCKTASVYRSLHLIKILFFRIQIGNNCRMQSIRCV